MVVCIGNDAPVSKYYIGAVLLAGHKHRVMCPAALALLSLGFLADVVFTHSPTPLNPRYNP